MPRNIIILPCISKAPGLAFQVKSWEIAVSQQLHCYAAEQMARLWSQPKKRFAHCKLACHKSAQSLFASDFTTASGGWQLCHLVDCPESHWLEPCLCCQHPQPAGRKLLLSLLTPFLVMLLASNTQSAAYHEATCNQYSHDNLPKSDMLCSCNHHVDTCTKMHGMKLCLAGVLQDAPQASYPTCMSGMTAIVALLVVMPFWKAAFCSCPASNRVARLCILLCMLVCSPLASCMAPPTARADSNPKGLVLAFDTSNSRTFLF